MATKDSKDLPVPIELVDRVNSWMRDGISVLDQVEGESKIKVGKLIPWSDGLTVEAVNKVVDGVIDDFMVGVEHETLAIKYEMTVIEVNDILARYKQELEAVCDTLEKAHGVVSIN